jgi:ribosome-associated protein
MLQITDTIAIPEEELEKRFARSSGPGGQNVNKVETRVELRFDLAATTALSEEVIQRLRTLQRGRITKAGVLRVVCQTHREQQKNLEEARERLAAMIREALVRPRARKATQPTRAARARRLSDKRRRSDLKRRRGPVRDDD